MTDSNGLGGNGIRASASIAVNTEPGV